MDDDMQAVIEVAQKALAPVPLDGFVEHAAVTYDGEVKIFPKNLAAPTRKRGAVTVFDAASFNEVVRDNADAGNAAVNVDRNPQAPSIWAVLNGHGPKGAGWGDLRVKLEFRPTPQWLRWKGIDGQLLPQADFAEFIEDNLEDIASPTGASMLEIATQLEAKRSFDFRSAIRLSTGQIQFTNVENLEARVGPSQIEVPESFTLGIAPLFGAPPYSVPVRFRYRLTEGKLKLGVKLQRVEDLMGKVLEDVIAKIERSTDVVMLNGLPPAVVTPLG